MIVTRTQRAAAGAAALLLAGAASATTFDIAGEIEECAPILCSIIGLSVGDPLSGFLVADPAAAGPNSTFTETDITDYLISANDLSLGPENGSIDAAELTTGADGEIVAGTININDTFDAGPPFNMVTLEASIDAGAGTWEVSATSPNLGVVASGSVTFALAPDTDGDGIADAMDNCIEVANTGQQDSDGDFYGNACDTDLNNDGFANFGDLALFKAGFGGTDPNTDFNSDGFTNFGDLAIFKARFGVPPGPSGTLPPPVTYTADVQPIFGAKCAGCHTGAGFGGHNIGNTYADAFLAADHPSCVGLNIGECTIVRIQSGQMPQGAGCTGDPVADAGNAACLTQAEQDTVQAWIDGGLLE